MFLPHILLTHSRMKQRNGAYKKESPQDICCIRTAERKITGYEQQNHMEMTWQQLKKGKSISKLHKTETI